MDTPQPHEEKPPEPVQASGAKPATRPVEENGARSDVERLLMRAIEAQHCELVLLLEQWRARS